MDHALKTAVSNFGFCLILGLSSAFALNSRSDSREATEPVRPGNLIDSRQARFGGNPGDRNSQTQNQWAETQRIHNQQQRGAVGQDSRSSSEMNQRRNSAVDNARALTTMTGTGAGADNAKRVNRK